jgi:hypothetical protein
MAIRKKGHNVDVASLGYAVEAFENGTSVQLKTSIGIMTARVRPSWRPVYVHEI